MSFNDVDYVPSKASFPTDSEMAHNILFRMEYASDSPTPRDAHMFFGSAEEKALTRLFPVCHQARIEADWLEYVWIATGCVDDKTWWFVIGCLIMWVMAKWASIILVFLFGEEGDVLTPLLTP